jgi:fructose-1,6-bisphosphatase I
MHPEATGELTNLLYDVALAAKVISSSVRRAGLAAVLGRAGGVNIQGEEQQKLDVLANAVMKQVIQKTGRVCVTASEEDPQPVPVPLDNRPGKYVLLFDPLDGSANIDVNASIGTIFSIHRRVTPAGTPGGLRDCLQKGREQVAAGYVIYGSSTLLVYATGHGGGAHGFTLDPRIGEFLLSHPGIMTPRSGQYYSVNESNYDRWSAGYREAVRVFKSQKNARYIGSLVADFHRNLIAGGIFMYPADTRSPRGKLRLLYEAAPLAFIAEAAGGAATDGEVPILDIVPGELHQRTPLVIGSADDVGFVRESVVRASAGVA